MKEKPTDLSFPILDWIMYWYYRAKWRLTTKKCGCGEDRYIPGTRTERFGISHGESPCYYSAPESQYLLEYKP